MPQPRRWRPSAPSLILLNNGHRLNYRHANAQDWRRKPTIYGAGSGGGGGYTAKAVHFNATNTQLILAEMLAADAPVVSYFCCVRMSPETTQKNLALYVVDPDVSYCQDPSLSSPASGQMTITWDGATVSSSSDLRDATNLFSLGKWHTTLGCYFTNAAQGSKVALTYIDDARSHDAGQSFDHGPAFLMPFNGLKFVVPDLNNGAAIDLAIFRFMPGLDLRDMAGTSIPDATRRLFYGANNKPVDPNVATLALGVGAVLNNGDAAGFVVNQGTDAAFTVSGVVTDAQNLLAPVWQAGFANGVVPEDTPVDTVLADLVASGDSPSADAFDTFSKIADPDDKFSVVGATLVLAHALNFDITPEVSVTIRATDASLNTIDRALTITVGDV